MMHKWLAHISQERFDDKKPQWDISGIYRELILLMSKFHENLQQKNKEKIIIKNVDLPDECICASGETLGRALYIGRINK